MEVIAVSSDAKSQWNAFVQAHYPPVGAFMQTWEWGAFQQALGRNAERFFVASGGEPIAAFTLTNHTLPAGHSYGYAARGPVIATAHAANPETVSEVLCTIRAWAHAHLPRAVFVRLEPPLPDLPTTMRERGFVAPSYYIQPRFNHAIALGKPETDIAAGFHPSTRSNLQRARNRGVTVAMKTVLAPSDWEIFFSMARDTIRRNSGTNAYPSQRYFQALAKTVPSLTSTRESETLSLAAFFGYQNGEPAAAHFVLFFGPTATYLYGASFSKNLSSKVTTYLHWQAMREANARGYAWYDLGGVDPARWPTLTAYKRQFRGTEFSYAGNLDILIRPFHYRAYNFFRRFKNFI